MVQHSDPYMTTGKSITLTIWTFVSKVISLLFNMLSRLVIAFISRSKHLLFGLKNFSGNFYIVYNGHFFLFFFFKFLFVVNFVIHWNETAICFYNWKTT